MKDSAAETTGAEEGESHTLRQGEEHTQTHTHTPTCRASIECESMWCLFVWRVCTCVCPANNSSVYIQVVGSAAVELQTVQKYCSTHTLIQVEYMHFAMWISLPQRMQNHSTVKTVKQEGRRDSKVKKESII